MRPAVGLLLFYKEKSEENENSRIGKVTIGDKVFIGAKSIILPNVTIGNNVVIGSGSVVTKSIQDGVVVAGSPARTICTIEEFISKNQVAMKQNIVFGEEYTHRGNVTQKRKDEMIEKLSKKVRVQRIRKIQ